MKRDWLLLVLVVAMLALSLWQSIQVSALRSTTERQANQMAELQKTVEHGFSSAEASRAVSIRMVGDLRNEIKGELSAVKFLIGRLVRFEPQH